MVKEERQNLILHEVNLHNKILTADLVQKLEVSEDTIRRDLNELAESDKIIKVHGGALSKSFHQSTFSSVEIYSKDEKKIIAQKAAGLIQDGMLVITTGGTTIIELARALPQNLHATFFTVSLPVAFEYMQHPNIDVIIIGDKISKNAQITVGGAAIRQINDIKADLCFLGTNAIDVELGLTDNDWDVVQVKRAMINSSSRIVSLTISEKVNTKQRLKVCDIKDIDMLVTELEPNNPLLNPYAESGLHLL